LTGADPGFAKGERTMAGVECKPIMGIWGRNPQRDPAGDPLVGSEWGELLKAKAFCSFFIQKRGAKFKDLSDSLPPYPRVTASRSHDQPLLYFPTFG